MIRGVRLEDLEEIMKIERQSFPVPWEYTIFLNICLQGGEVASSKSSLLFMDVIEESGSIVGYAVWEIDNRKARGHILNLAVRADRRRRGRGRMLLSHVINHLMVQGATACSLEVRENNFPARALYESKGFAATSRIMGYYWDEDAIVYTLSF
jgi:ribosomal-protein-alanine N-acetyltransferase